MVNLGLSNENQNWGTAFLVVSVSIIFMVLILLYVFGVLDPDLRIW